MAYDPHAHHAAPPWSQEALAANGFDGFVPFADLPDADVPAAAGVYAVLRSSDQPPAFTGSSPGARRGGVDPAVSVDVLQRNWVEGPEVLYVGRATVGADGRRGLRKRLEEYRRFGAGTSAGHRGGRLIWQLADHTELRVAWNATHEDAAAVESRMLRDFVDRYDALPFANLRR